MPRSESATSPACEQGARDLECRIRDMDTEGIDVQVLYGGLIIGLTSYDDAGFALDVARTYNDWLLHNGYIMLGAQVIVAKFMETFKEFPRAQKPGSFTIEDAHEKMSEVSGSS